MELLKFDITPTTLLHAFAFVACMGAAMWALLPALCWMLGWL